MLQMFFLFRLKSNHILETIISQELFDDRHKVAFKTYISIHLVDLREDSFTDAFLNQLMQVLFQLPNVALDEFDYSDSSLTAEPQVEVHWKHEVLCALDEVRQVLMFWRIRRCPSGRIFCFDRRLWYDVGADELLDVLPFRRILDHFDFRMLLNTFEGFRSAITWRSTWNNWNCSLKMIKTL